MAVRVDDFSSPACVDLIIQGVFANLICEFLNKSTSHSWKISEEK